jgi:hypothetical protein
VSEEGRASEGELYKATPPAVPEPTQDIWSAADRIITETYPNWGHVQIPNHGILRGNIAAELDAERRRAEQAKAERDEYIRQTRGALAASHAAKTERDQWFAAKVNAEASRDALAAENAALRAELTAHRDKARGDYWAWQGDGNDYLESLICPVLIPAASLRGIIAERAALRQEVAGLRAGLGRMTPLAERAALVIAHHALNSRECSLVCRRCEAEKVLAQARQLLDRPA